MEHPDFSHNLKSLLLQRLEWFEKRQLALLNRSGVAKLTLAQGRIFAQLKGQHLNISELAKRLGVSRQAAHRTVASLVDLELLELRECTDNMSAKYVHITEKGHEFRTKIGKVMQSIEDEIAAVIGHDQLKQLKKLLEQEWG